MKADMKAVLFDFNGTLFDDTNFHRRAWHDYMYERFGRDYGIDEINRYFIGPGNREIFRHCFDGITEEKIIEYGLEKEIYYRRIASETAENMRLIDGAPELFDLLTARGIPFVLVTASPIDNIRFYLNDLGLKKWFDMSRVVYDTGELACKPEPDFYLEAARRVGLDPQDCIVVEDSLTGFEAAKRAKAGKIIAIDRTQPPEVLAQRPEIDAVIHDFTDFERFL